MGNTHHFGRGGAAGTTGMRRRRREATRATASIGVSLLATMITVAPVAVSPISPAVRLSADSTALLVCGITCPTWDDAGVEAIMDRFVTPTHPDQTITPVAVTAPGESWPLTGVLRLLGSVFGDPRIFGPGGPSWPDEPWWKLSGLFDLTADQSIEAGAANLEAALIEHPSDSVVIYGLSLGAGVANVVKKELAEHYPEGAAAPDVDFVLQSSVNVPNGGLYARFPGVYIPILDWTFNGPAPTDTVFDTVVISTQYDGFADFPLYPINLIADLNAVLGILYLHTRPFDVSLPEDPTTSPAYQGTHGDSSFYFFETRDLPLFAPLRMLGVPEPLIDVVEPFFRVLVELGYDRSIPLWEPTAARLFPKLDAATVFADLGAAIGEGIDNALALVGLPPIPKNPVPVIDAEPPAEVVETEVVQTLVTTTVAPTTVAPHTEQATPADAAEEDSTEAPAEDGHVSTTTDRPTDDGTEGAEAVEESIEVADQEPTETTAVGTATSEGSSSASSTPKASSPAEARSSAGDSSPDVDGGGAN